MNHLRTAIRLALSTSRSNRELGKELGIAYNTVRRYREVARAKGYQVEELLKLSDSELQAAFANRPKSDKNKRMPDWHAVHRELQRKGVTRTLLWLEYKEQEPETAYELSRFNDLYREWGGRNVVSMRQQYAPGERGWVDFSGTRLGWVDPNTGELHPAEVFVASVSSSGLLFACTVPSQRQEHWIHAHAEWFHYLGGVPHILVPDNLKSAVIRPGRSPVLNPAYEDMADHYGCVVLPARPGAPQDKGLVENGVLLFLRWGVARLRNRVFYSPADLGAAVRECVEIINDRQMRLYKQSRRQRFELFDKPALMELPARYEFCRWTGTMRVPPDYHIAIDGHFYSVPYRLVQSEVYARATATFIEIFSDKQLIATHARSEAVGEKTTERSHMPARHLAWADHNQERYLEWATGSGPQSLQVVQNLLKDARHPAAALNACATLQSLSQKHGKERFELACRKALEIRSPSVKSIRSILQNKLEQTVRDATPQSRPPLHGNLRGPSYYQNTGYPNAD